MWSNLSQAWLRCWDLIVLEYCFDMGAVKDIFFFHVFVIAKSMVTSKSNAYFLK